MLGRFYSLKGKFTFLGTGASTGVPVIGCRCSVCLSKNPYNNRYRTSGLIEIEGKKLLIDIGPDFRTQALKYDIENLDALFVTHIHSDHIAGIDDVRIFYFRNKKGLDCYLSSETLEDLKVRYHYLFKPIEQVPTVTAQLDLHLLDEDFGSFMAIGKKFTYLSYFQGKVKVSGLRIGDFAYLSDIKEYDEEIFFHLKGVKTLVISALKSGSSPVHFNLDDAVKFSDKVGVDRAYFTHISHDLEHEIINNKLPSNRQLAFDGQIIDIGE